MRSLKLMGENSMLTKASPGAGAPGSGISRSSTPSTASPYFTTWTAFISLHFPRCLFKRAGVAVGFSCGIRNIVCAPPGGPSATDCSECFPQLLSDKLRLLECREVATAVDVVPVDEVRPVCLGPGLSDRCRLR